ncbi:MAG: ABC transporter substrate-binding protein [Dethiobacter sp.]|nr:MAG: ABC transporter substrate-binding protein [Dethiobacter sp.]
MLRRKRLVWGVLLLLVAVLVISGCAKPATPPDQKPAGETYKIGIVQIVEHPALDAAREGFIEGLASKGFVEGEKVSFDYKSAQGEMPTAITISEGFIADKVDLILAIATPCAQAAATATKDIPILITAVTDPVAAGVAQSLERPNTNVTGTTDMNPVKEQLELILEINSAAKNVGVIYNSGEVNSVVQVEIAKKVAAKLGLKIVEAVATNSGEVGTAAESLVGKVDAIYIPTDNTVVSALRSVVSVAEDHDILLVAGDVESVVNGAVATLGITYYGLGYQTGLMAAEVLQGADPATMPILGSTEFTYAINKTAAKNMGVELPQSLIDRADEIYE